MLDNRANLSPEVFDARHRMQAVINRAVKMCRIQNGLVLCDNCDTPASREMSLALSWTACGPCATGESDSFDLEDVIFAGCENAR